MCGDYGSDLQCDRTGIPADRHYAVWYDQQDPVSMRYAYKGCGKPKNDDDSAHPLHQKKKGDECQTGFAMGGKHEISKKKLGARNRRGRRCQKNLVCGVSATTRKIAYPVTMQAVNLSQSNKPSELVFL